MAGRRSDPGIDRPRARPLAQEGQFGQGRRRHSSSLVKERGGSPHTQLQLPPRTAEPADPGNLVVNPLVGATDVLVKGYGQILEPVAGPGRHSPHPHLHEDIIRTYVRSVKYLRPPGRGERIPFVVTAIVLIEAERSAIAKLGPALADVPGVAEAYSVTGEFDFVVIVRVKNHEEIADVVTSRLSQVPGIVKTHTHVAFKVYSKHDLEAMFSVGLQEAR